MAQPDFSDGSMIALYPPPAAARKLAIFGGLPAKDLHLTVAYTGDAADTDRKQLRKAAKKLAKRGPVTAAISGHARFTGAGDKDVIVALVDSPQLEQVHGDSMTELADRGVQTPSEHGFTPHITIAYIDKDADDPVGRLAKSRVTFDGITAAHGKDRKTHLFDTSLAEQAREAYTSGWALSGGPLTPRVKAGCAAAVQTALEHADDPAVLEATLHIGKLEGTWARFFARREQVIETGTTAVRDAWNQVAKGINVDPALKTFLADAGKPYETDTDQAMLAGHAAASVLTGMYAYDQHHHLDDAVQAALRAGWAEGQAGLLALDAEKHGYTVTEADTQTYPWNTAYQKIYDELANLPALPLMAQQWIRTMLAGCARSIGVLLATLLEQGASRAEMATELEAALDAAGSTTASYRAVTLFMDQATGQAMSQAALDLYQSEGIADVYFVTAGDERVCEQCLGYEAGSPYTPSDAPVPCIHPRCRCVLTSDNPEPFKALAAQLFG